MTATTNQTGSCLCGGVSYRVTGKMRDVVACHCSQCRKTSGSFVMATACAPDDLILEKQDSLRWYRSSPEAERGFCQTCGSNLFWKPAHGRHISITAGTLNPPTGLKVVEQWHVADKSDYYEPLAGVPIGIDHAGTD
jgi:hypothetical protein